MAWIYLAESEDSVWPCHHGSALSPTVRSTDTVSLFFCLGCETVRLAPPQYGTTLPLSYLACCPEMKLISSTAGSRARTLALQEMELAWKESEVVFSLKLSDLQKKLIRHLCSLKTCQQLELADFEKFSENLPIWGMLVDGRVYLPEKLAPVILEKDGFYLPTPTTIEGGRNRSASLGSKIRPSLGMMAKKNIIPTPMARDWKGAAGPSRKSQDLPSTMGGHLNPQFVEEIMGYPIGWTELKDWAMQWFHIKPKKHLKG